VATEADPLSLPFQEAIDHFRGKLNVPSARWADIREGAHARAFTVAGAMKDDLLGDFRTAIDKAIAEGTTIADFRRDFDQIVATHGWDYNGGRGWRTRVIYSTNLSTAYSAGRYQQMTDPDVQRYQPYWRYRHADGEKHPRPEHLAWDGLVLRADDPWWTTHYPPNGWGCGCWVEPLTERELRALGKTGPDKAPALELRPATLSTSAGPVTIQVPKGIDPGWGYNVGDAAFGRKLPEDVMEAWRQKGAAAWERLNPGDWQSAGRPAAVPADRPAAKLGTPDRDQDQMRRGIERAIGGPQRAVALPNGDTVLVDAAALAAHMPLSRATFIPLLPELLADPFEIWLSFERHRGTGQVVLRKRLVKVVDIGRDRGLLLVAQASGGFLEAWTFVPTQTLGYLQGQRAGSLLWARDLAR
jgi:hypothetical protein